MAIFMHTDPKESILRPSLQLLLLEPVYSLALRSVLLLYSYFALTNLLLLIVLCVCS
jgi:hypothetical protein